MTYDPLKPSEPVDYPRELPKQGWHVAVCAMVIPLGYQKFGQEISAYPQVSFLFELAEKKKEGDYAGKPHLVSKDVSNVLSKPDAKKKSGLVLLLSAWTGREYSSQDKAFSCGDMLGKAAFINIVHKDGYANIGAIGPLPEGMKEIPATVTEIPKWIADKKAKAVQPAQQAAPGQAPPHDESDLPF